MKLTLLRGVILACLCGGLGWAQAPTAAPTYPDKPPPPIAVRALSGTGYKIPLKAGWNLVSFPFAQVSNIRGLNFALMKPAGAAYTVVNPLSRPLDTRYGYWAYAAQPGHLEVTGTGAAAEAVPLEPGWNLVGCPTERNLTVTQLLSPEANKPLAFAQAFGGLGGNIQPMPLASGTVFQPGGTYWVYAYRRGQLQWKLTGPGTPLEARPVAPPTSGAAEGQAILSGKVTDRQAEPVYKANVVVSGAQGSVTAVTDTSGHFSITVPAGPQRIEVITRTCEPLQTTANLVPGANEPLRLVLVHRFGTLNCQMYTFNYEGNHFRPVKVEMWETVNPSNHYTNFYNRRWERYRTDAYWKPFPLGASYTVQVTWEDGAGTQLWSKRTGTAMQPTVELTFYNSWT